MAKSTGKLFEDLVKISAQEQGFDVNRMRDAGFTGFKEQDSQKRFTSKNICDFTLYGHGKLFYIEAKHSNCPPSIV